MSNMTEVSQLIVKSTDSLVENLDAKVIDNLVNIRSDVRKRALETILSWIDIETPYWLAMLNFLPLSLSKIQWSEVALSFLETLSLIWEHLDMDIVQKIYLDAVADMEDEEDEWGMEYNGLVIKKIDLLLSMWEKNSYYSQNSQFYNMVWSEYERRSELIKNQDEREKMLYKAIIAYNKMIEMWNKDWFLWTALVYKKLWKYDTAISLLKNWYDLYLDLRFLDKLVHIYTEIGDIAKAKEIYAKMQILYDAERENVEEENYKNDMLDIDRRENQERTWWKFDVLFERGMKQREIQKEAEEIETQWEDRLTEILPFVFYSNIIESDKDLREIEFVVTKYFIENELIPSKTIQKIVELASEYIENEINKVNARFNDLKSDWYQYLSENWRNEYKNLVLRRLFLSQIDLFGLRNDRYLDSYLVDVYWLLFRSWEAWIEWLKEHFEQSYSMELKFEEWEIALSKELIDSNNAEFDDDSEEDESNSNIHYVVWKHISLLSRMFFSSEHYESYRDRIIPLLYWSHKELSGFTDLDKNRLYWSIEVLKYEVDFFDSLRPEIVDLYNKITKDFDENYWVFYRKIVQYIARSWDFNDEEWIIEKTKNEEDEIWEDEDELFEIPQGIFENPQIAVYFWIEKILCSNLPVKDIEWLEKLIEFYWLNLPWELSYDEALAFWTFLWYANVDVAIKYFLSFPDLLENPHTIYNLLEWIREMTRNEWKKVIKDLNKYFQKEHKARWFFDFINKTFSKLNSMWDDLPVEYDEYMMLCLWDVSILKWEWIEKSKLYFKAAVQYGSVEAMIQLWDLYEVNWYFDDALSYYEMAFNNDNNINTISKIINLLIQVWRFDEAKSYIDAWITLWYELNQWIYAYLLWSGKYEDSMKQVLSMLWKWILVQDIPTGTIDLFFDSLDNITKSEDNKDKNLDKLKIWATYLQAVYFSWPNWSVSTYSLIEHRNNIEAWMWDIDDIELYKFIEESVWEIIWDEIWLYKFTNEISWIEIISMYEFKGLPLSTRALMILSYHANNTLNKISKNFEESKESLDVDLIRQNFKIVNDFIWRVSIVLKRFPWSEKLINDWKQSINFIVPWVEVMNEEKFGSTMIH